VFPTTLGTMVVTQGTDVILGGGGGSSNEGQKIAEAVNLVAQVHKSDCSLLHNTALKNVSGLQGCIDQVDSLIYFDAEAKELQQWDDQIQSVCTQLNQIMDTFAARSIQAA
jgi:hypothetical protein